MPNPIHIIRPAALALFAIAVIAVPVNVTAQTNALDWDVPANQWDYVGEIAPNADTINHVFTDVDGSGVDMTLQFDAVRGTVDTRSTDGSLPARDSLEEMLNADAAHTGIFNLFSYASDVTLNYGFGESDRDDSILSTFTFSGPVLDVTFDAIDVDKSNFVGLPGFEESGQGDGWIDQLTIVGYLNGQPVYPTFGTIPSGAAPTPASTNWYAEHGFANPTDYVLVTGANNNILEGRWEFSEKGNFGTQPDDGGVWDTEGTYGADMANVTVSFPGAIDSFTIEYANLWSVPGVDDRTTPDEYWGGHSQETGISDIGFTPYTCSLDFDDGTGGAPGYQVGDNVFITAEDVVFNTDLGAQDTLTVTLTNNRTGETEDVQLLETGVNTGIFSIAAGFPTTTSGSTANNDGTLNVQYGDTVTVTALTGGTGDQCLDTYRFPVPTDIVKAVDMTQADEGDTLTYTIDVNYPAGDVLTDVTVTDAAPAGTTLVASSANAGGVEAGSTVTWNLGSTVAGTPISQAPGLTAFSAFDNATGNLGLNDSINTAVAMDASGKLHVVFEGEATSASNINIYYTENTAGSWSVPLLLSDDTDGQDALNPSLALDSSGNAHVVYTDDTSDAKRNAYYVKVTSGAAGTPIQLSSDNQSVLDPAIAVSGSNVHVVFDEQQSADSNINIHYRLSTNGGTSFAAAERISDDSDGQDALDPAIAVSGSTAHIVYTDDTSDSTRNVYHVAGSTGSFGTATRISDDTDGAAGLLPDVAVDSSGNAFIVYTDKQAGDAKRNVYYTTDSGGSFATPVDVTADFSGQDSFDPVVGIDVQGAAHLSFRNVGSDGGKFDIFYVNNQSGSFGAPAQMTTNLGGQDSFNPDIAVGTNSVCVVFDGKDSVAGDTDRNIYATCADMLVGTTMSVSATPGIGVTGDTVTVTAVLTSTEDLTGVLPVLTPAGTNNMSVSAAVTSPSAQNLTADTPVQFVWTYTITEGVSATPGQLTFQVAATNTDATFGLVDFGTADSNSLIATPVLEFQVTVDAGATSPISNVASVQGAGEFIPPTASNAVQSLVGNTIGDFVWVDTDGDGIFDVGEVGLGGVTVTLAGDAGAVAVTSDGTQDVDGDGVVDPLGYYRFTGLAAGNYSVTITEPAGYTNSYDKDSGTVSPDDTTGSFAVGPLEQVDDADFGLEPLTANLSGTVYFDDVGDDNVFGAGDTPVLGVIVQLWSDPNGDGDPSDGVQVGEAYTDSSGNYLFSDVPTGNYVVVEIDPIGASSDADTSGANDNRIAIAMSGTDSTGNNFLDDGGSLSIISGSVYDDDDTTDNNTIGVEDAAVVGVTVELFRDSNGNGVFDSGEPLIASATTDISGGYLFENLPDGDYVIVETDPAGASSEADTHGNATDNNIGVTLSGSDSTGNNFLDDGIILGSIGDLVFVDAEANGSYDAGTDTLADGVTVDLWIDEDNSGTINGGDTFLGTQTTSSGAYDFTGLLPGDYLVDVTDTGNVLGGEPSTTGGDTQGVTLAAGQDYDDADFGYESPLAFIAGQVRYDTDMDGVLADTEAGIPGVTIELRDSGYNLIATTTTDADGNYSFTSLDPGDYWVVEVDPIGYTSSNDFDGGNIYNVSRGQVLGVTAGENRTDIDFLDYNLVGCNDTEELVALNISSVQGGATYPTTGNLFHSFPDGQGATETSIFTYEHDRLPAGRVVDADWAGTVSMDFVQNDANTDSYAFHFPGERLTEYADFNTGDIPSRSGTIYTVYGRGGFGFNGSSGTGIAPSRTMTFDFTGLANGYLPAGTMIGLVDIDGLAVVGESVLMNAAVAGGGSGAWLTYEDDAPNPEPGHGLPEYNAADNSYYMNGANSVQNDSILLRTTQNLTGITFDITNGTGGGSVGLKLLAPVTDAPCIMGTVRNDTLDDDTLNGNEPGIGGVVVTLWADPDMDGDPTNDGYPVATTVTDENGDYAFPMQPAGSYVVVETDPANSVSDADSDGTTNNTVNEVAITVDGVTSSAGHDFLDDITALYSLSGSAYDDGTPDDSALDVSGGAGPGDTDVADGTVVNLYLDADGNGIATAGEFVATTTTTSGDYSFTGLPNGDYIVFLERPLDLVAEDDTDGTTDSTNTDGRIAVTIADANSTGNNYLVDQNYPYVITGQVRNDVDGDGDLATTTDVGIQDVTITLFSDPVGNGDPNDFVEVAQTTTDANGDYKFEDLPGGDFVIVEGDPLGFDSTNDTDAPNDNSISLTLENGIASSGNDFLDTPNADLADIGGTVYLDTTENNTIDSGSDTPLAGIEVRLVQDNDGDGIADAGEAVLATTYTGTDGSYLFEDQAVGNYVVVEVDPSGSTSENDTDGDGTDNNIGVTLTSGGSTGNDFLDDGITTSTIGGQVTVLGTGDPIPGVTVTLKDAGGNVIATAVTDSNGDYSFPNLPDGSYTVEETDPAGTTAGTDKDSADNDNTIAVTLAGSDVLDNDFADGGATLNSIAGTVYDDDDTTDNDTIGVEDAAVSGVTIELFSDLDGDGVFDSGEPLIATTTTDTSGNYLFENLPNGDYVIVETDPAGSSSEADTDGVATDNNIGVTLSGSDSTGNDFLDDGADLLGIGDRIFIDADGDNSFDAGEGLSGVSVELWASGEDPNGIGTPVATTTSGVDGFYVFEGLAAGDYFVHVVAEEFQSGGDLEDYVSLGGATDDATTDSDDNGIDARLPATTGISTREFTLSVAGAPTDDDDTGYTGGLSDSDLNLTADLGFQAAKPYTWPDFQTEYSTELGAENGVADNPDGDSWLNLEEYAFCLNPGTGLESHATSCAVENLGGGIDIRFMRRLGGLSDVKYTVQGAAALGDPTTWTDLVAVGYGAPLPAGVSATPDGQGEEITVADIDGYAPLSSSVGFTRIKIELDTDNDGNADETIYSEVCGWQQTSSFAQCETCSVPFLKPERFSGEVLSLTNPGSLEVSGSLAGSQDIGAILLTGGQFYVEVIAGDHEGQRWDVNEIASDADTIVLNLSSMYNTSNTVPATVAGDQIVVRQHWTLGEVVPLADVQKTDTPGTADKVLFYDATGTFTSAVGSYEILWAMDFLGTQQWRSMDSGDTSDHSSRIVGPCEGFYIHRSGVAGNLRHIGVVRENVYCCPLIAGTNLLPNPFPADASTSDWNISVATGYTGSDNPSEADQIMVWEGDGVEGPQEFGSNFLMNWTIGGTTYTWWAPSAGDSGLTNENDAKVFKRNRSTFIKLQNAQPDFCIPPTWSP